MDVIVIGVGFHAKRIYIPELIHLREKEDISWIHLVDIEENRDPVSEYSKALPDYTKLYFLPDQKDKTTLGDAARRVLSSIVDQNRPGLVIISTEPRFHRLYAEWAIRASPSVLMDKPITTRKNASTDEREALGIWEDFLALRDQLQDPAHPPSSLIVNTQRRYDSGFQKCLSYIRDAKKRFGAPVTSVLSMYSDGTWVMPNEFSKQESHPYKYGYGICSHSGYHIFDFVAEVVGSGTMSTDYPQNFVANARAIRPNDFVNQIGESTYRSLFDDYLPTGLSAAELRQKLREYGEIDAHCHFSFENNSHVECQATVVLNHNSFSQRSWPLSKPDLYKGNGRVKQQLYIIHQGPFQSIHIHNFQSQDKHDVDNTHETSFGQNNHFDIHILRNAAMFGLDRSVETFSAVDLYPNRDGRLSIEDAKRAVVREAILVGKGKVEPSGSLSSLHTHALSVQMLSAAYISMCRHYQKVAADVSSDCFNVRS